MTVRFEFDWVDDMSPSPDALAHHSMVALSIEVAGETVTSVIDRRSRAFRDRIVVPLFGVAEWLAYSWFHIFHEIEDTKDQKPDFAFRHDLAFAGDGFILPSLTMVPAGETVELRWRRYRPPHAPIEFVNEGSARVERGALETAFRDLIDATVDRLRERGANPEALEAEWEAVNTLDSDERMFCRAAALLGADPFDVAPPLAEALAAFWDGTDAALRDDALAAANADSLSEVGAWCVGHLSTLGEPGESEWRDIRESMPLLRGEQPWERGYALARAARASLQAGEGRVDFDSPGFPRFVRAEAQRTVPRIQGLVAADSPACATVSRGESGRRFLTARALGDYLDRSVSSAGILSTLATDRQALSRAFAAEFLAPAEGLRQRLRSAAVVEAERLDDLGAEFGVSSMAIRHQIENHNLATVAAW